MRTSMAGDDIQNFFSNLGIQMPSGDNLLATLLNQGTEGVKNQVAEAVLSSPEIQQRATTQIEKGAAAKIADFLIQNKKLIAVGIGGVIVLSGVTLYALANKKR